MMPKIQACLRALETVPRAHVLDGRAPHALIRELFTRVGYRYHADQRGRVAARSHCMTTTTKPLVRPQTTQEWIALEQSTFFPNRRPPVVIERGQGCRVWDVDGREYLDMIAGIAVVSLGHSSPVVQRALAEQSARLIQISNLFYSIPQLELAQLLLGHSHFGRVFFCNSGAEANEAALKLARRWGKREKDGAFAVITAEHAFHGRTLATVTATGQGAVHATLRAAARGLFAGAVQRHGRARAGGRRLDGRRVARADSGRERCPRGDARLPARRAGLLS